jgi:death on curing protein
VTEWVALSVVLAIHDEQMAEHGGAEGTRDLGLLQSALHRPQNLLAYGEPDLADLAACYAYGIANSHAFVDGNKRTSAVVTLLFLRLNGATLQASEVDSLEIWTALGAGQKSEADLATWIRQRLRWPRLAGGVRPSAGAKPRTRRQ